MDNWEIFEKQLTELALNEGLNPEIFDWKSISDGYEHDIYNNITLRSIINKWINYYKELGD